MLSRRYNLINNIGGWFVFLIALVTYWLTLEPTASYWDCGEFIIQADKLEVGHPPGNPIFMLTARFFANFAPDAARVSLMVNAMSGLLSALTILLLFWTITHLVRRLVVKDTNLENISTAQYIAIMGSGLVGALAYCWSDTFWFSAVEGEVYAFSSFCTALVFWLILKWEYRADRPHSDRYLILIAYVIGVSIAVHLLNLLCIPAIVLVYAYRRYDMNLLKSLLALFISFVIVFFVLYGLVPGFIKVAQQFELFFVNTCGMSFNSGALIYAFFMALLFVWAISELYRQRNANAIKVSFTLAVLFSGVFFIGSSAWIGWLLTAALVVFLWLPFRPAIPVRLLNVVLWSMAVIFIGYSSYALILIRSTADTPMNQNSPDNVFALASYLNREQYGENPLFYGETMNSGTFKEVVDVRVDTIAMSQDGYPVTLTTPTYTPVIKAGQPSYAKGVKDALPQSQNNFLTASDLASNQSLAASKKDYYVKTDYRPEPEYNPELNMIFPRLYSSLHKQAYANWVTLDTTPGQIVPLTARDKISGQRVPEYDIYAQPDINETTGRVSYPQKTAYKPTYSQNLQYFLNYQLNHMYMRYFMWNFAGRQNDILNQNGELDAGNWISGIPFLDNARLGDQSLLPAELGKDNPGHNVFFMLPLILGIIGLIWQSFAGRRGIEQFWVVFFLFFMTGIAIVLYLNQTPGQPRERDYAFAGSFYAYAIWIGMGVAALWRVMLQIASPISIKKAYAADPDGHIAEQLPAIVDEDPKRSKASRYCAALATLVGLVIPFQMVSQTWDDHDRSGRYAARDYAINYLESLEPNAIVFCNGDNDTFPLWYVQEVEGVRPDVRIINLSYLASDWYAAQMLMQAYDSKPVSMTAKPSDIAYDRLQVTLPGRESAPADLLSSLKILYRDGAGDMDYPMLPSAVVTIPVDKRQVVKRGLVAPADTSRIVDQIEIDLANAPAVRSKGYLSLSEILMLDIIATNAAEGWPRPIYWAMTVGDEYHLRLTPYLRSTGMTHQIVPTIQESPLSARTDRAYNVVTGKYRWGGAETGSPGNAPYFDETARRMVSSTRMSMVDVASELIYEGDTLKESNPGAARKKWQQALSVLNLLQTKLPEATSPYSISVGLSMGELYGELGSAERLNNPDITARARKLLDSMLRRYAATLRYRANVDMQKGPNQAFTPETQLIPYQYYRIVELYTRFGGKTSDVEKIVKPTGYTLKKLKENYDLLSNNSSMAAGGDMQSAADLYQQYASEITGYAGIVNEMASLAPADYAARSEEERLIDSSLYILIDYYLRNGGDPALLEQSPDYRNLDKERSRALSEQYQRRHPELR